MADTGQELIEKAIAAADRRALERIEAARARREREKQQRAELAAARAAGLARRHATRLRQQATRRDTPTTAAANRGPDATVADPTVTQTDTVAAPDNEAATTATTTPNNTPPAAGPERGDRSSRSRAQAGGHARGADHG